MGLSDKLRHVRAGLDRPSAAQQNIIVDLLKQNPHYKGPVQNPSDYFRVTAAWDAYSVIQIEDIGSNARGCISYGGKTFAAPNSDNFEILICDGTINWASFGFRPVMALISGVSFPAIGAYVGPKSGEVGLYANYPGFRFIGESPVTGIGWVIRDRATATGQGTIITSSGQEGTPASFQLESVTFSSGFNGWDGTSDLEVINSFGDTAAAGLLVQFKWDAGVGAYVSTDVECPP